MTLSDFIQQRYAETRREYYDALIRWSREQADAREVKEKEFEYRYYLAFMHTPEAQADRDMFARTDREALLRAAGYFD